MSHEERWQPSNPAVDSEQAPQRSGRESETPVSAKERIFAVDALRGMAVLGILLMNIPVFAMPPAYMMNPTRFGDSPTLNASAWLAGHVLVEGKMRCLFSMLFGAGVIILTSRAEERGTGAQGADIYYRRTIWLMIIGLLHAYFLWEGDILFWYGALGLLLYPFRKLSGATLVIAGIVVSAIMVPQGIYADYQLKKLEADAKAAEQAAAAGEKLTEEQTAARTQWNARQRNLQPKQAQIDKRIKTYLSDYWTIFVSRMKETFRAHPIGLYQVGLPDVLGMMMIGMGLMKLGVITASRSLRFYIILATLCYAIGLPLNSYLAYLLYSNNYDRSSNILFYFSTYNVDRITITIGHACVLMIICKTGVLSWLTSRLSAVGQMALTNYIMQSVLCTFLFYGYGLGLFGQLQFYQLIYVVLWVWCFQLLLSPIWLSIFRFGPLEWLWRTLTYLKVQPMLRRRDGGVSSSA